MRQAQRGESCIGQPLLWFDTLDLQAATGLATILCATIYPHIEDWRLREIHKSVS